MDDDEKLTALERLEGILNEKDAELGELRDRVAELEDESERVWDWARHETRADDGGMPVPRLELRCRNLGNWYNYEWVYALVYRHLLDHIVAVPLGYTKCGGAGRAPTGRFDGDEPPSLPFRDGCHSQHDREQLGLPLYAVCEELGICYEVPRWEKK